MQQNCKRIEKKKFENLEEKNEKNLRIENGNKSPNRKGK